MSESAMAISTIEPAAAPEVAPGEKVIAELAAAESSAPVAAVLNLPAPSVAAPASFAAPPTVITPIGVARPLHADDEETAPRILAAATVATPMVIPKARSNFGVGAAIGLLAGAAMAFAISSTRAPAPVTKGPISVYLEGAEALVAEGKYEAAGGLLDHVRGLTAPDPAQNVRLIQLQSKVGLEGGALRVQRLLAVDDIGGARGALHALASLDPPPERLAQLSAQIEARAAHPASGAPASSAPASAAP